ncbi:MAG: ribosome biogenesis GTPase Der [Acidobacteriota bacterium]
MFRVAIVGRPNVGKSTLFNRLTRTRKAIVGDEPGITRDRLFQMVEWEGRPFEVIDTGGIIPDEKETIPTRVLQQAEIAIEESDLILFVVDGRVGVTPLDEHLNSFLRSRNKEIFLVVNKLDVPKLEEEAWQFYSFGAASLFPISAEHKQGVDELLDAILERVPLADTVTEEGEIRIAIIGRPNVGKSSLLNRLAGKERVIVSDVPGTTRDAVDTRLAFKGREYRLIDTAGIRRKGKTELKAEKLSVIMARKNIEQADVVFLLLDATEGATKMDATIGGYAHEAGKSVIIVVNKWDVVEKDTYTADSFEAEFRDRMRFLDYAPMLFTSAKTGQRVLKILDEAKRAYEGRLLRVPTAELNQFLETKVQPLLVSGTHKFPLMYASQIAVGPPTFVFFTRSTQKLHFSTERFIINQLRKRYQFYATPIRIRQRTRKRSTA